MSIPSRRRIPRHAVFGASSVNRTAVEPSFFAQPVQQEGLVVAATVVSSEAVEVRIVVGYLFFVFGGISNVNV
jgi:hypothetical protein